MYIGGHISIGGGHANALEKIVTMGGNSLQIFSISPRGWEFAKIPDEAINTFVTKRQELEVKPIFFHASYLVNFADNDRIGQLSKQTLKHELRLAARMGVRGSIVHLGSFKEKTDSPNVLNLFPDKYKTLIENIGEVLNDTPEETMFIMENAGNRKLGKSMEEVFQIVKDVASPRMKVCLDTCHLHAAGYALTHHDTFEMFLDLFDKAIGINKLELWHMNDSKDPFCSFRDRHENLGEGMIGLETFSNIMNHKTMKNVPMIIETPGFDGLGPDKANIDILKGLMR